MDGSLCLVESTITSLAHRCRSGAVHPIIPGRCEASSPESITTKSGWGTMGTSDVQQRQWGLWIPGPRSARPGMTA
jgi:hypothetical protein